MNKKHKYYSTVQTEAFVNKVCKQKKQEVCGYRYLVCGCNKYLADTLYLIHTDSIWCASVTDRQL